jgi:hypothetical protein
MKKTIFTFLSVLILFVFANQALAQVPQGFNYQAVARNSAGVLLQNQSLGIIISLHQGSDTGPVVYSEKHGVTTNQFGLFTVSVGQPDSLIQGNFSTINWNSGDYWMEVKLKVGTSGSYTSMGTTQLLTVPYAMYAANSGTAGPIGPTGPQGIAGPTGATGLQGIQGVPGTTGATGLQGIQGIQGIPGPTGAIGAQGIQGIPGTTGPAGSTGIQGPTGTQGLIGPTGPAGTYTAGPGIQISSNVISANLSLGVSPTGDILTLTPGNSVYVPGISNANNASPVITTYQATNISSTQAYGSGNIVYYGVTPITETGICWDVIPIPPSTLISSNHKASPLPVNNIICTMTPLTANTVYYIWAYAIISGVVQTGNMVLLTTLPTSPCPELFTLPVTSITTTSAYCGGNITSVGGTSITTRGICWNTNSGPLATGSHNSDVVNQVGNYWFSMTGLTAGVTYYVRAYAINNVGCINYGPELFFTTTCTSPTISTTNVITSGCNSAVANCQITALGCATITQRGVCWDTINPPDINDNISSITGNVTGTYSIPMNILRPNTTYYVRSYALTSVGPTYGNVLTFSTSASYYESFEFGMPQGWVGNWSVTNDASYEGYYSLKSTATDDSVKFTTTISNSSGGQISFYYYTNTGGYPQTKFYIDNNLTAILLTSSWTGPLTYPVTTGTHTFKWVNVGGGYSVNKYIDYVIICP